MKMNRSDFLDLLFDLNTFYDNTIDVRVGSVRDYCVQQKAIVLGLIEKVKQNEQIELNEEFGDGE